MNHSGVLTVKTDDFEMEYFHFGSGSRTMVIIPGVSLKSIVLSADAIAAGFEAFTERYTVYVFARRKNLPVGYTVMDMAEDTSRAMQALGLSNADIFGASQGGMIAQAIALTHPELVHALYLGSTMSRINDNSRKAILSWIDVIQAGDIPAMNHAIFTTLYSKEFYEQYKSVFAVMETDGTPEEVREFRIQVGACLKFDIYDRLAEIKCPVFVVGSYEDHILYPEASIEMAKKLNCSLYMYDGYSHAVYDEAPDFRDRMLKALSSID